MKWTTAEISWDQRWKNLKQVNIDNNIYILNVKMFALFV